MKKGCVIGIVAGVFVVVVSCAGVIFLAFGLTAGAVGEADRFLELLGEGKTQEAYQATSESFRAAQTEESFSATIKQLGLNEFASASWTSRSVENDLATIEGTVKTRQGGANQLTMKLIKESGQWRVLSLSGPAGGATAKTGALSVPPDEQLRQLADQSLSSLNAALQAKDFKAFHATIARLWQRQDNAAKLLESFQTLIDRQVDLSEIKDVAPVFDEPPVINDDRLLVLSGYYPGKSFRAAFKLKYTYEHPDWKLMGIHVSVVPDPTSIPSADALQDLVKQTLLDFNTALRAKEFTEFYGQISKTWQGQTSAEKLAKTFKNFVDKQIDISPIQDVSPEFSKPPTIDKTGVLNVKGVYPTQPLRVVFELKYVSEQSEWKLLGISLNLRE